MAPQRVSRAFTTSGIGFVVTLAMLSCVPHATNVKEQFDERPADPDRAQLSEDMQRAVNTAFETLKPIVVSYVDENGAPQLSFRGSTQAYSDTQLAIWVRNPEGRILESIEKNPAIALLYGSFEPTARAFMIFRGRARVDAPTPSAAMSTSTHTRSSATRTRTAKAAR